ncbi:MAG: MBL fold metallo-hydrolase [Chthoniobacterales bacterium]
MPSRLHLPTEFHRLRPGLSIWNRYDSAVKADLYSTAVATGVGTVLVDPIEVPEADLARASDAVAIVVSNANHVRASEYFSRKFAAPIYASTAAGIPFAIDPHTPGAFDSELEVIEIEGAAAGEIALFFASDGGTVVMGDALINFGSHGFTFLPAKYCSNQKLMRKSLRKLLDLHFERMLFAHGAPIMNKARDRLAALLAGAK